ncbi:hypothetical protein B0H15DRAFT_957943 [Mycena belliarum]|uniref:Uncharacterized protein n=1 Tax=Mycena belliarum TaxID=1033014 RepID=A0AAD6XG44_9AGAR|nr:hypothetical protein B0H15DRAFT_957943 [Mycena belliae]
MPNNTQRKVVPLFSFFLSPPSFPPLLRLRRHVLTLFVVPPPPIRFLTLPSCPAASPYLCNVALAPSPQNGELIGLEFGTIDTSINRYTTVQSGQTFLSSHGILLQATVIWLQAHALKVNTAMIPCYASQDSNDPDDPDSSILKVSSQLCFWPMPSTDLCPSVRPPAPCKFPPSSRLCTSCSPLVNGLVAAAAPLLGPVVPPTTCPSEPTPPFQHLSRPRGIRF